MKPNLEAEPEVFATGFVSPEGPAFNEEGELFVCDFGVFPPTDDPEEEKDRHVYKVSREGKVAVFADTGGSPTGSAFHKDGRLFVCDSGRQELISIDQEGNLTTLASEYKGNQLKGPNDLTFDLDGNVYFTDPGGSDLENPNGDVYLYRSDGSLQLFDQGYAMCNGIAIGPQRDTLFMAETHTRRIYRFELAPDGTWKEKEVFAELEGGLGPDGMRFDCEGNLYVAQWGKGRVAVLNPQGKLLGELPTIGDKPTNVGFWDGMLYVTEVEKGQVVRLNIDMAGLKRFKSL